MELIYKYLATVRVETLYFRQLTIPYPPSHPNLSEPSAPSAPLR
ncbi:MAG: hypothetical protein WCD37_02675 [Chloroflexia bacterium]